ncbi:uncharacterized protein A1O5_03923 [Cladophialophora psammophila CBS 110553]|uniref:Uncharacterized protein n=1 Tax=Cladophialophora psammophila CBS 110553 TaxID=1182543 RepID=W9X776_9EURO|nr:uncharacterized protein A1O5_03923 [Cladophialophora psammophila CBS 110553]EXJ72776.1 hypothetical protein A1O5_03923 [Cladophialophora psammophila CBS 110553]
MQDAIRAGKQETRSLFATSSYTWSSYLSFPSETHLLAADCVNLPGMLGHVPAFPDLSQVKLEHIEYDNIMELWATGSSVWKTTKGECDLQDKIVQHRLLLGISSPASLLFTADDRFRNWPGAENIDQPAKGNCIAILTLAWCYILSAKWTEIQQPSPLGRDHDSTELGGLVYLPDQAQFGLGNNAACSDAVHVDLGGISHGAARWWAAILASGTGWEAAITYSGKKYLSPWSIRIGPRQPFLLWRTEATSQERELAEFETAQKGPPSSTMALQYLSEFCSHYEISSQCLAALATALIIPYQGRLCQLKLPRPRMEAPFRRGPLPSTSQYNFEEHLRLLPFYMSISCNTRGMRPLLHGPFYEPSVSCNLVDSWLEGAFKTIDPIIRRNDYSGLATVLGRRQSRVAPIWLGAIILGIENQILQPVRAGMFAIDILSAAWTSTSHSFVGPRRDIPSRIENLRISRADECRLLYIAQPDHTRVPVCPWEPFGYTDLHDADIEVREHACCAGKHCLQYDNWAWDLRDGRKSAPDRGFIPNDGFMDANETTIELLVRPQCQDDPESEGLAEIATRSIFGWLRSNGYPSKERGIWMHPWLNVNDSSDEEIDDLSEGGSADGERGSTIENWISKRVDK